MGHIIRPNKYLWIQYRIYKPTGSFIRRIIAWEDGALMVPQQISGITVYLSYTRRHNDLTYSYDKDNIILPGADWQPGQQITYVLTLKPENYIEIGEPIVEPWIDSPSGGGTIIVN